jgi:ADP-ribose pyrophosphatase
MAYPITRSRREYDGAIIGVRVDTVELPGRSQAEREVVEHRGSVAVVPVDGQNRVLLIQQYRHPAGKFLWELPAGLRDQAGEQPLETAQRELAEETGLRAEHWSTLVDLRPSPGICTETCRVYLATQLQQGERPPGAEDEEHDLNLRWISLPDALAAVFAGSVTNSLAVAGVLAASARLGSSGGPARPADAPWPDDGNASAENSWTASDRLDRGGGEASPPRH